MRKNTKYSIVFYFFLVVLAFFCVYELNINNAYIWDSLVLILLIIGVYIYRKKVNLSIFHFFLIGIFLVLHNLGVFGFYDQYFLGIEFDTYVHTYCGFVLGLVLYRAYDLYVPHKNKILKFLVIVTIVLGVSAFHEILEYVGGEYLGEGMGFLRAGASDVEMWDVQTDMRNNLIGSLIAIGLYMAKDLFVNKKNSIRSSLF